MVPSHTHLSVSTAARETKIKAPKACKLVERQRLTHVFLGGLRRLEEFRLPFFWLLTAFTGLRNHLGDDGGSLLLGCPDPISCCALHVAKMREGVVAAELGSPWEFDQVETSAGVDSLGVNSIKREYRQKLYGYCCDTQPVSRATGTMPARPASLKTLPGSGRGRRLSAIRPWPAWWRFSSIHRRKAERCKHPKEVLAPGKQRGCGPLHPWCSGHSFAALEISPTTTGS